MKKTALITGGAGFIGSFLCDRFVEKGYNVVCLDNLYTGSKDNIKHLNGSSNFEFVQHDVIDLYQGQVDLILNFACPASPVHYQKDPVRTLKTSVIGTLNLLELARKCGARFLQASTSEVYGDPLQHPQTEAYWGNVNPIGIRSCYDEGKRAAETLCFDFRREYRTDVRVVRIFNTYGPRMACDDGRVVSNFITQALKGEDITIYGDGKQSRSFCYVDDLVSAIAGYAELDDALSTPVNIGNDREFQVGELAELVQSHVGSGAKVVYKNLPEDDPKVRRPDLSLAKKTLDWSPQVALEEGVAKTIPYFRDKLGL